jgi:hypothetical protein
LTEIASGDPRFDKVFAINVNLFWVQPDGLSCRSSRTVLRPGGRLYLFNEAPTTTKGLQVVQIAKAALLRHGFATATTSDSNPR